MKRFLTLFILISIFVHLSGYWGTYSIKYILPNRNKIDKSIEVSLIEKDSKTTDQNHLAAPIRFTEAPKELIDDNLELLKKKVELLSEKVQRVKKETRAKLFGLTKNRWKNTVNNKSNPTPSPNPTSNSDKKSLDDSDISALSSPAGPKTNKNSNIQFTRTNDQDPGESTFGNDINKNVEVGSFTALNTDRHLYYSFYSRIEEMIRPPWENDVSIEAKRVYATNPLRPKGGWTTRLDVILNSEGKLIRVSLLKGSGVKGFDDAATTAFQKASFFPHPPKGIINEDGIIVLKYLFTVY